MHIKYKSIKNTIGRFIKEFNITDTTFSDDIPQWVEDAIGIMEVPNYYVPKYKLIKIEHYRGHLPCDIENIFGLWCTNSLSKTDNINNLERLIMQNNPLIGKNIKSYNDSNHYGSIDGRYVHTSFQKGYVYLVYKGMPLDCDGFPLVPDDPKVHEALQYYFIYRMSLSGYKHPVIDFTSALQLWEKKYPAAANNVNWMDRQDYQEFTEMWTNAILGDLHANNYIS
jgi:hypothetical protein